jgi:hypothetical protein
MTKQEILDKWGDSISKIINDEAEISDFDEQLWHDLYEYFVNEMPYGTAKARDGDPMDWVLHHLSVFEKPDTEYGDSIRVFSSGLTVAFSDFVRRQTPGSQFSHWDITDKEVFDKIEFSWPLAKQGYREGVLLVPVAVNGFFSSTVQLTDGDRLVGDFCPRQEGETPRRHYYAVGDKLPAKSVTVVLYHYKVLEENDERSNALADYEIISINASPTDEEQPIPPMTLMANHFEADGGTATNMSDEEFVAMLRKGFEYWQDKALVAPSIDPWGTNDAIWGTHYIYCASHLRVHSTGWCTVPLVDKVPLCGRTLDKAETEWEHKKHELSE